MSLCPQTLLRHHYIWTQVKANLTQRWAVIQKHLQSMSQPKEGKEQPGKGRGKTVHFSSFLSFAICHCYCVTFKQGSCLVVLPYFLQFFAFQLLRFLSWFKCPLAVAVDQAHCELHHNYKREGLLICYPVGCFRFRETFTTGNLHQLFWQTQPLRVFCNWKDISCINTCFTNTLGLFKAKE